ncbi:MAG: hypothetical protein Q9218_003688, partial [Villophora microphyllina]
MKNSTRKFVENLPKTFVQRFLRGKSVFSHPVKRITMKSNHKPLLLAVLPFLFTSISSLILDIPSQMIANALSRSTNFRGPPIPPGFSMRIVQDPNKPLNTTDLYICAIETMYHWAANGYDDEIQTHTDHSKIIRGLQISFHDIPERPINMCWKHLVLSILLAVDSMDRLQVFAETVVEMKQDGKNFGIVRLGKPPTMPAMEPSGITNSTGNSAKTAKRDDLDSVGVENAKAAADPDTAASKTITDPDAPIGPMTIIYQRFGHAVKCSLLFSTALDGMAYLAADYFGDT